MNLLNYSIFTNKTSEIKSGNTERLFLKIYSEPCLPHGNETFTDKACESTCAVWGITEVAQGGHWHPLTKVGCSKTTEIPLKKYCTHQAKHMEKHGVYMIFFSCGFNETGKCRNHVNISEGILVSASMWYLRNYYTLLEEILFTLH